MYYHVAVALLASSILLLEWLAHVVSLDSAFLFGVLQPSPALP